MDKVKAFGAFMVNFVDIEEPLWYGLVRFFIWGFIAILLFPLVSIAVIKWITFWFDMFR